MTNNISSYMPTNANHYAPKASANKANASVESDGAKKTDSDALNGVVKTDAISAEQAASNILNHVANGLNVLRRSGASEEQIQERLEQAKAGIEKGYAEAKEILDSMGLLTEELSGSIAAGRKLVDQGIEALAANKGDVAANNLSAVQAQQYTGSASMSLEMRTLEGDLVKISFEHQSQISSSQSVQRNGGNEKSIQQFSSFSETGWQVSVQGSLSESELDSLNKVIKGVQKLGEAFFSGDLSSAMKQAGELGLGADEIASLSLSMQQTQTYTSVSAYQSDKKESLAEPLRAVAGQLANFADQVKKTFDDAKPLAAPNQLLKDLTEQMWQKEENKPQLLSLLDAFEKQI